MEYIFSLLLGLIQGLTEFLPISSSGHLQILNHFFDFLNENEDNFMLIVILHFATCLSTIVIFKKKNKIPFFECNKIQNKQFSHFFILYILIYDPSCNCGFFFRPYCRYTILRKYFFNWINVNF